MKIKFICCLLCIACILSGCGVGIRKRYETPAEAFLVKVGEKIQVVEEKQLINIDEEKMLWVAVTKDFNGYGISTVVMDCYKGKYAVDEGFSYAGNRITLNDLESTVFVSEYWNHVPVSNSDKHFMWQVVSADGLGENKEEAFNYNHYMTEINGTKYEYVLIYYFI